MNIEFRKHNTITKFYYLLVDDVVTGSIHDSGGVWCVRIHGIGQTFDLCKDFGSLETAQHKVREHYEGLMEFAETIEA